LRAAKIKKRVISVVSESGELKKETGAIVMGSGVQKDVNTFGYRCRNRRWRADQADEWELEGVK